MSILTLIWVAAFVLIGAAFSWMLGLIVLRVFDERRAKERAAARAKVEAALVAMLQGRCDVERDLKPHVHRARLMAETLLDFLALVRGPDRGTVVSTLEEIGVAAVLRARVHLGSDAGRMACLEALGAFPGPETQRTLEEVASDGSPRMRVAALRALQETGTSVTVARVVGELAAGRLRATAVVGDFVRKLASSAPGDAIAALDAADLPVSVRLLLIDALGAAGDYSAVTVLCARAIDPEGEVRAAAVTALGKLKHPAAAGTLKVALHDPDWRVRSAAAEAVGAAKLLQLSDQLSERLGDDVWRVRFQAAAGLARMGPTGQERLVAAASREDAAGRAASLALAEAAA